MSCNISVIDKNSNTACKLITKIITLCIFLFIANSAMATNYECNTTQVLQWKNGKFIPDNNHFSRKHEVLRFDDQNSKLWFAMNADAPFSPLGLNILRKMSQGDDMIATFSDNADVGGVFRLRKLYKSDEVIFILYSTPLNAISTGNCNVINSIN